MSPTDGLDMDIGKMEKQIGLCHESSHTSFKSHSR